MIYRDISILNGIRNYVANSMQSEIFTTAQLAMIGNTFHNLQGITEDKMKYIKCGSSVCGSDEKPVL